jgi:hypothetical protein
MTDDEKSLVDQALDAFVYAPLGILLEARDLLPKLAERGRGQVTLTRLAGKVAAQRGRAEAERLVSSSGCADSDDSAASDDSAEPAGDLPIEGYDELTAPNILPKLETLTADELGGVLGYEQSHRARATVINRINQLQA